MRLRIYQEEDAVFICKWICSEEEMFKWSADRINRFPLLPQDINENNNNARYCYEAVGFREYSRRLCTMKIGTWECIDMELFL